MTAPTALNPDIAPLLRGKYTLADLAAVRTLLAANGTLQMTPLPSGLFSAAAITDFSKGTNYHAAWVRDNIHVAYSHFTNGQVEVARGVVVALTRFFRTQHSRFLALIANPTLKTDPQLRPHIRFAADTLTELDQKWSHAQNDALGYFVWLTATLARNRVLAPAEWDIETLALFPRYFRAIQFWSDEDSGHWEEVQKVAASSIGAVVAGLRELRAMVKEADELTGEDWLYLFSTPLRSRVREAISITDLDDLIGRGTDALKAILPNECIQPDPRKNRPYDAALLFLIYPLGVVERATADEILHRTITHLVGPVGVRRYLGDSFYCTNYESLMAHKNDDPTRDFSSNLGPRDAMLRPGEEAQWCLFDPILSTIYGQRYWQSRDSADLEKQTLHLNRALAQITAADPPRCRALQCPELYYIEGGKLQTSKSTPLLWTQANLWTALEEMRKTLELAATVSHQA
jgi:hypothetical protein